MDANEWLGKRFEEHRRHLRTVAHRMLGSLAEADDAVQEAWLRLSRSDDRPVENLGGWLTTVVARVCLDVLRARAAQRKATGLQPEVREGMAPPDAEHALADSVGPALLVVLETLAPAERVAFVLHDVFDVAFEEIGAIVGRSPAAARQLASRARRRVRGEPVPPAAELSRHRQVVDAFLAASKDGDFTALLALLHPEVVLRADSLAVRTAAAHRWGGGGALAAEVHGAVAVAQTFKGRAHGARSVLVDGEAGAAWIHGGQTRSVWTFAFEDERIAGIELVMEPDRLAEVVVAGAEGPPRS